MRILTLISVFLSVIVFTIKNKKPSTIPAGKGLVVDKSWLHDNPHSLTPLKDQRPPDQAFLTFPEWFLVFSPAEQADYFQTNTSTTFPYMKHVDQMWKGYQVVYDQVKGSYKFNTGYHAMIVVIAGSTTVEYSLKSWYETIIGRLTDTKPGAPLTDEDQLNAAYMSDYVSFIEKRPWYEYDFNNKLRQLWSGTSLSGQHFLRKAERRYYLTTELAVKSAYGWLIGLGTKAAYDPALDNTTVIVDTLPVYQSALNPPVEKNVRKLPDGTWLMDLPRYAAFNSAVFELAQHGIRFKEVAGNNAAIMLTVLTAKQLLPAEQTKTVFTQPIETKAGVNRIALVTPVANLSELVKSLLAQKVEIEHIYDY